MSSILSDLGVPTEYRKKLSEQTDGGEQPLSVSELQFLGTAVNQTPKLYDTHQRFWGSYGQFLVTDAQLQSLDAHGQNFKLVPISEMPKVDRKD